MVRRLTPYRCVGNRIYSTFINMRQIRMEGDMIQTKAVPAYELHTMRKTDGVLQHDYGVI